MKTRSVATCQSCGARTPRWVGRCPECGEWGSVVEELESREPSANGPAPDLQPLPPLDETACGRLSTGLEEADRVLGGGLVRGSVLLLAGEPGIGKSTLTLQAAMLMATHTDVLLVCGEESPTQVAARAGRLDGRSERIRTLADPSLPAVLAAVESGPDLVVVDSVQTLYDPAIPSAPGSVAQVRECGSRLARAARDRGTTLVLVGHVTKDGSVAGPRVLEHLVDVVCAFEGDRGDGVRVLRALKNRFGSTQEAGFFEMTGRGLAGIRDATSYLLADRCPGLPGSVLGAFVEGRRAFLLEIQGLVAPAGRQMARRTAIGVDSSRLPLLVAVLQRRLDLPLSEHDVYVSAVGGISITEPAADLAVVCALLSAWSGAALPDDLVAFGEVGLAGEVRQAASADRRLAEAAAAGFRRAVIPWNTSAEAPAGMTLHRVRHVRDLLDSLGTSELTGLRNPLQGTAARASNT
ncbi:MAG TPA: DNA repair protein RadA [Actinomycetota bacterium]|nr:DNA repair protein RadA [Actinomycetota bacterium]